MRKLFTLLFALMIIFSSKAAVYWDDTFNYNLGQIIGQGNWEDANPGTGTATGGRMVIAGNLAYSNTGGTYTLSGQGKTLETSITTSSNYFIAKRFNPTDISSGDVYVSFLFSATASQLPSNTGSADLVALSNYASGGAANSGGPRVWVKRGATAGTFMFGTTRYSTTSGDITWGTQEFSDANTVFVVLKYDATAKKTYLYVNPVVGSASEPAAYAAAQEGTSTRNVCNVLLRANGSYNSTYNIGGLRVSGAWADAVAAASTTIPTEANLILQQPAEGGSIAASPDKTVFDIDEEVTITATPATNYFLKNFVVNGIDTDATSANTLLLTMDEDKTVSAVFQGVMPVLTLTQPATGGSLAASPDKTEFAMDEEVTITATPAANFTLKNFVVNGANTAATSENTLVLTMDEDKTVSAVFEEGVVEWIINPARGSQTTNYNTANGFVRKADRTTIGVPKVGDIVYVEDERVLGLNSNTVKTSIVSETGGTLLSSGGCTVTSISMANSTFSATGVTTSRTIDIEEFHAEGNNVFDIAGTVGASTYFSLGRNGSSGNPNIMKMTGSGTIIKKGEVQLILSPSTDLENATTFSGKWIVEEGELWSRNGSRSDKRVDFFPGTEIEVHDGGTYRIERMYTANDFISGDLSEQKITVKDGGRLVVNPQANNSIGISQSIVVETRGVFNINETTGTGTTIPTLTIEGDVTLWPDAVYNVNYGAKESELFTVNNTIFKSIQSASLGLVIPKVTFGTEVPMPEYTGNITFEVAYQAGQTTADISPLFANIPADYTSDIFMTYWEETAAGEYTLLLPTLEKIALDGAESWILYDNSEQKVDLSRNDNSYQFTVPGADMVFKWAVSTIPVTYTLTLVQSEEGPPLYAEPDKTVFEAGEEVIISIPLTNCRCILSSVLIKYFVVNGVETPATDYNTLVLIMDEDKTVSAVFEPNSIDDVNTDKGVIVSEKYYTLTGIEIQQPATGILIKKVVYNNGTVETTKIFK